jgi:transketolase
MREQIINSIFNLMEFNPDIYFLTGDMGINLVEKFEHKYPDRYTNVGIAEQNLIGVSAGLANIGYRPFAYTISNFAIHRCFEQIRNDICLHQYPITILGTSTGFDNAPLGPTHHIIDDWGVLKSIPGIDIYCPSSKSYAEKLIKRVIENNRPAYIRIPKGNSLLPLSDEHIILLKGLVKNTLLISYGNPSQSCIEAQKINPNISVLILNRLRPLDEENLQELLGGYQRIIVVEDHFPESGMYGLICEFVGRKSVSCKIESLAPRDYTFVVGTTPKFFFEKYGIDTNGILQAVNNNNKS